MRSNGLLFSNKAVELLSLIIGTSLPAILPAPHLSTGILNGGWSSGRGISLDLDGPINVNMRSLHEFSEPYSSKSDLILWIIFIGRELLSSSISSEDKDESEYLVLAPIGGVQFACLS